jgi:hypothetical protein
VRRQDELYALAGAPESHRHAYALSP